MRAAYPGKPLRYRSALGAYTAGVGVNSIVPAARRRRRQALPAQAPHRGLDVRDARPDADRRDGLRLLRLGARSWSGRSRSACCRRTRSTRGIPAVDWKFFLRHEKFTLDPARGARRRGVDRVRARAGALRALPRARRAGLRDHARRAPLPRRRDRSRRRSRGCSASPALFFFLQAFHVHATLHNALLVAGGRVAGDALPGDAGRRRDEAGADRLPVPRRGDLAQPAARVQRRDEHRASSRPTSCCGLIATALMARTLSFKRLRVAEQRRPRRRPNPDTASMAAYASVYPLVPRVRRARVHLRGRRRRPGRARSSASRSGARARAGSSSGYRTRRRPASRRGRSTPSSARCRQRSSSSRSGSPTTTARRRRARSHSSRPDAEAAQGAGAARGARRRSPPRRRPLALARAAGGGRRIVAAIDAGGGNFLLYGATGSGKTEVYLQACAAALERGLGAIVLVPEIALAPQTVGRVRARFGDRVACSTRRSRDAERRDERERIAIGRGADRGRRALGGVRAGARARPHRRRRGARPVLQAGLRPALRRAHGRGEACGARGRGGGVRLGDAAAGELGGARAARARRPDRRVAAAGARRRPAPRGRVPALGTAPGRAARRRASGGRRRSCC